MNSYRNGGIGTGANVIKQGWYAPEDNSGSPGEHSYFWLGAFFFDDAAMRSALGGKIIDSVTMTMTSDGWGVSGSYELNLFTFQARYSSVNGSRFDPDQYHPQTWANQLRELGLFTVTPAFERNQTQTFPVSIDILNHAMSAGGNAFAIWRQRGNPGGTSYFTRRFSAPPILTVTYREPVSNFTLNRTSISAGENIVATIASASPAYTHRVTWIFGTRSETRDNVGTSDTFLM